jgi:peptide/nickel transport system substrate-binding protein
MTRRLASLVAVVATAAFIGACGGGSGGDTSTGSAPDTTAADPTGGGGPSGTVVVGWESRPESWAPGTDVGEGWPRAPYETLVQRSPDDANEIEPMLATEWEQTDKALTLTLRDDVVFHDGTPFDAEAVKANIEFVKEEAGPFSAGFDVVKSIDVVDDHTVRLNLRNPAPALLTTLAGRGGLIASPKALADGTVRERPVGTGPWAFNQEESIPDTRWVFDAFEDYYAPDDISLERIEMVSIEDSQARLNAIQTGEIDLGDLDVTISKQAEGAGVAHEAYPALHYALFMLDRGPGGALEDVETRRALCQSMDAEAIAAAGGPNFTTAVDQRYEQGALGYAEGLEPYTFDESAAATLRDKNLDLSIAVFDANSWNAEALAGEWDKHGVKLNVQQVPAPQYFESWYSGEWPVGLGDNSELHPYDWYRTWFAADAPNNPAGVESDELRQAADKAIAAGTSDEADALWADVMQVIHDEALVCMHEEVNQALAWNEDAVTGVEPYAYMPGMVQYRNLQAAG